jgi:hypothetical protein
VDAVASGAPPGDDDEVADAGLRWPPAARGETDRATENERVCHVPLIEQRRAVDRGDAHLVSVVGDAGHHSGIDALWWQRSRGEHLWRCLERTEAEDVGVGDRLGRDPEHVAHDATHPGIGAAERLQGTGVIVGFDLEGDLMVAVEGDHPGVVLERREHPGPFRCIGGRHDGRLQEARDLEIRRARLAVLDRCLERAVRAVLRPGLGDGLQLDVGRVAVLRREVIAYGFQVLRREGEQLPRAELLQRGGIETSQGHRLDGGIG